MIILRQGLSSSAIMAVAASFFLTSISASSPFNTKHLFPVSQKPNKISLPYKFSSANIRAFSNNKNTHQSFSNSSSRSFTPLPVLVNHLRKFAVFLVGSVLFTARFYSKPSLVLADSPTSNFSNSVSEEEKNNTREGVDDYEQMYARILERNPRDVEALKVVLYGKMRRRKFKQAVEFVERLIDVEPDEVEWRLLRALCCELMGQVIAAKKFFKEILEERPLHLKALHGLAMAMHKNNEGLAVFEMLCKALELARRENRVIEERNIRILIAQMHVVKGNLEEALNQFQDLINENHRDFRPYLCQGIIYSLLNKQQEADKQFEIYKSLVPEEFPQRSFLDDVVLAAKAESKDHVDKAAKSGFQYSN